LEFPGWDWRDHWVPSAYDLAMCACGDHRFEHRDGDGPCGALVVTDRAGSFPCACCGFWPVEVDDAQDWAEPPVPVVRTWVNMVTPGLLVVVNGRREPVL
jgi:hypothetical protein